MTSVSQLLCLTEPNRKSSVLGVSVVNIISVSIIIMYR